MKLGLDCPTSWLPTIQPHADYDYVLVEKCLKDKAYLDYFKKSPKEKLLNNRLMGADLPRILTEIRYVWDILGGMVIAPDWGNNHLKTLEAYGRCCGEFGRRNVIGVVQGIMDEEVQECLATYGAKVAVGFDVGSEHEDDEVDKVYRRIKVVQKLASKKVHLLGMTHPGELSFYRNWDYVESMNTGLPVLLGFKGIGLLEHKRIKDISSYNYMDMDYPPYDERVHNLIKMNLRELRRMLL